MSAIGWGPAITYPIATSTGYITNGASGGADMFLPGKGVNAARNWMAHETGHAFGLYDEDLLSPLVRQTPEIKVAMVPLRNSKFLGIANSTWAG